MAGVDSIPETATDTFPTATGTQRPKVTGSHGPKPSGRPHLVGCWLQLEFDRQIRSEHATLNGLHLPPNVGLAVEQMTLRGGERDGVRG